jgi:hypothetical protein
MRYIILKEIIPSMKNTPDYNEDMCFITLNYSIENDELYVFNTLEEAQVKRLELLNDSRYEGRELKIKETTEF